MQQANTIFYKFRKRTVSKMGLTNVFFFLFFFLNKQLRINDLATARTSPGNLHDNCVTYYRIIELPNHSIRTRHACERSSALDGSCRHDEFLLGRLFSP